MGRERPGKGRTMPDDYLDRLLAEVAWEPLDLGPLPPAEPYEPLEVEPYEIEVPPLPDLDLQPLPDLGLRPLPDLDLRPLPSLSDLDITWEPLPPISQFPPRETPGS